MKTVKIVIVTALIISNVVFFVYGWILRLDCQHQRSRNEVLQRDIIIREQKIENLKRDLLKLKEEKDTIVINDQ